MSIPAAPIIMPPIAVTMVAIITTVVIAPAVTPAIIPITLAVTMVFGKSRCHCNGCYHRSDSKHQQ